MWGIWESYYKLPKAIFYLLKGDYSPVNKDIQVWTRGYLAMSGTAGGKGSTDLNTAGCPPPN